MGNGHEFAIAMANENEQEHRSLAGEMFRQMPSAAKEMAKEAWEHPWKTAEHVGLTLGTAAIAGKAFSLLLPSRGPAAIATGLVMTIPLGTREYFRWQHASDALAKGADFDTVAHDLAKGTLSAAGDTALGFAGGTIGTHMFPGLGTSDTMVGRLSQQAQRKVLAAENATLKGINNLGQRTATAEDAISATSFMDAPQGAWFAKTNSLLETRMNQIADQPVPTRIKMVGSAHAHTNLSDGTGTTLQNLQGAKDAGLSFYAITEHNHLAARDGVKPGDPRAAGEANVPIIASNPKAYAQQFLDAAKVTDDHFIGLIGVEMGTIGKVGGGVKPTPGGVVSGAGADAGAGAAGSQAGGAEAGFMAHTHDHAHGPQLFRDTEGGVATQFTVTEPDGTVLTHRNKVDASHVQAAEKAGIEIHDHAPQEVTLTKPGDNGAALASAGDKLMHPELIKTPQQLALDGVAARDAGHHGGVNHINMYEVPTFVESVRETRPQSLTERFVGSIKRMLGSAEKPADTASAGATAGGDVVLGPNGQSYRIMDGDMKALVGYLDTVKDTTGKRPVIQLNHPRFQADWDPNLPEAARGRDYGIKSFKNIGEWRDNFGKYASQVEIITGEALNPNKVDHMGSRDLGPINMAGYIDKGLHVSPTFGRDDHFNIPGARPAATEVYATQFSKEGLLDAMRERRTSATTSYENLSGHMTVNDKFFMGDILDQAASPDLSIKMHVGGKIDPTASYKVSLYADTKIGDGKLATPVQVKNLVGQDILDTQGAVAFDKVQHLLGNKSAWYVEVQRKDPVTANTDYLWTAPVWVEPGASSIHSPLLRGIVGAGTSVVTGG